LVPTAYEIHLLGEDPGIDGRMILKMTCEKWFVKI
jgi:hypothetical protein